MKTIGDSAPTRGLLAVLLGALCAGCQVAPEDFGRAPAMTPLGAGLSVDRVEAVAHVTGGYSPSQTGSTWRDSSAYMFRDARAVTVGDVVTVKIDMKDKASLDNSSNRSRDSKSALSATLAYAAELFGISKSGDGDLNFDVSGTSSSQGKGAITRSEKIDMMVAALVTEVLPNGNFIISGSQEVRVNFEVRVLSISGIVRPRDLGADNSVSYERIAEARISYGGRGRIMEVQQPPLVQQAYDLLAPY